MSVLNDFINLFFPNVCPTCGKSLLNSEKIICTICRSDLPFVDSGLNGNFVKSFGEFEHVFSLFHFSRMGKAQKLIHDLKYGNAPELGNLLGVWIGDRIIDLKTEYNFDVVIPVPLHKSRLKKRGYNQSDKIAEGISERLNIPCDSNVLQRIAETDSQTSKTRVERIENVSGIFGIRKEKKSMIAKKSVLLVDDVITTGATILSAYDCLLENGAEKVSVACIARA